MILSFRCGEEASARQIVDGGRRVDGASPGQDVLSIKLKIRNVRQRVELFAAAQYFFGVLLEDVARVISVDVLSYKLYAPLEGAYLSISVALRVLSLARVHPAS
jgi:hypothetical protein